VPAETSLGRLPAKGDAVEEIGVPSAALEPLRERRIAPPCAPGPRPRHAASAEALLEGTRAFSTVSAAPFSDEQSARSGSTDRTMGAEAPGGAASRSARHGFYDRTPRNGLSLC